MRVPWFNWMGSRVESAKTVAWAPSQRSDADIDLALRLIPQYALVLQIEKRVPPQGPGLATGWRRALNESLGMERAERAFGELSAQGRAVLAVCPRETAEHYCAELRRLAVPCMVTPL